MVSQILPEISRHVRYLRYLLLVSAIFSVGSRVIISTINGPNPIHTFRFFTLQSNFMVLIWTFLALIWENDDKYNRLTGFIKGSLTTYITITCLVFAFVIEPVYDPVGIDWWTSLCNHYLNPLMFVLDFVLAEKEQLEWRWSVYWMAYPLAYLAFAMLWALIYDEYLYFFLNADQLGFGIFLFIVVLLCSLFLLFGLAYIYLNRRILTTESHIGSHDEN